MSVQTIGGLPAGLAGDLDDTALVPIRNNDSVDRKYTVAQLRTQINTGAQVFTAGATFAGAVSGITTLAGTGAVSGFASYASSAAVNAYQTSWASTGTVITGGVYIGTNGTLAGIHFIATSNHGLGFAVNNGAPALIISNAGAFDFRSNPLSGITTLAGTGAVSGFTSAAFSGTLSTTAALAIASGQKLYLDGVGASGDTYITEIASDVQKFVVGGGQLLLLSSGANSVTIGEPGVSSIVLITTPSSATRAGIRLGHGAAPTSPVDGDMWTTTAGLYVRINGVTVGPLS